MGPDLAFGMAKNLIARVSILARFSGPSRGRFRHGYNLYFLAMTVVVVPELSRWPVSVEPVGATAGMTLGLPRTPPIV